MKIKFKITNLHIEEATREAQKLSEAQKSLTPRTNSEHTNSEYRYGFFLELPDRLTAHFQLYAFTI